MRAEILTTARREILVNLAELLQSTSIDESTRLALQERLCALLDRLLYLLDTGDWDRRTGAQIAEFVLVRVWPEIVEHLVPTLEGHGNDARRLQRLLDTPGEKPAEAADTPAQLPELTALSAWLSKH